MKTALVLAIWLFATILHSQGTPAPDVVIVETLQTITGYHRLLPGTSADAKGACGPDYCRYWLRMAANGKSRRITMWM